MLPPAQSDSRSNLPAVPEQPVTIQLPAGLGYSYEQPAASDGEGVPLSHYLWILRRHVWKIAAFVVFAVAATVIVSSRLTPVYEATATIDVDRRAPTGVVGQDSQTSTLNDADQFLATQIKIIQSDAVLRRVVHQYNPEPAVESAQDKALPSADREDAPVLLKKLKVTRPPNTYLILISYRNPSPRLAAEVANAVAESYRDNTFEMRIKSSTDLSSYMKKQTETVRAQMERSGQKLADYERQLGYIDPEQKTSILTSRITQLTTELTKITAERVEKGAAYDAVSGGGQEAVEVSGQGESLRKVNEKLNEANDKFAQVKTRYAKNHPEYRKAESQVLELQHQASALQVAVPKKAKIEYDTVKSREQTLGKELADAKAEFDSLNTRAYQYKQLKQDADNDKKLYDDLERKLSEAGINASFQDSSIRITDEARPPLRPDFPDTRLNALLAFLFSSLLAVGAVVLSDVLDRSVRDPEQVARMGTQVVGSLPSVPAWHKVKLRQAATPALNGATEDAVNGNGTEKALAKRRSRSFSHSDGFEEAIRSLRDSILLSDSERRLRSLVITSATPSEGKTTTSTHLALAHAAQLRKTLIIDGDLRRPSIHSRLGVENEKGLSDVITEDTPWRDCLVEAPGNPDLKILTAGPASRRAADRIGVVLEGLLREATREFDLVIVDCPPLLGFAEPLQMASLTDGTVIVAKAGQTDRRALQSVLEALKRLKANVVGVVLNEVSEHSNERYYYYGYYGKYYSKYYGAG